MFYYLTNPTYSKLRLFKSFQHLFQETLQELLKRVELSKVYADKDNENKSPKFENDLEYRATRNPIVLCHGLYGFDKIGFEQLPSFQIHYWQGVNQALKKLGNEVFIVKVSSTGSIAERAHQLHKVLNQKFNGRKVNLVGHSMGGLDGRYLISRIPNDEKKYKVASLTTISTPHRGSSFMDWCKQHLKVGHVVDPFQKEDLQLNSIDTNKRNVSKEQVWLAKIMRYLDAPAYSQLTTEYCTKIFNPQTPDDPNVKYYSYTAYVDKMSYLCTLYFPWQIINSVEGKNDGLVSVSSSNWGHLIENVHANHFDLVVRYRWLTAIGNAIGVQDARCVDNPTFKMPEAWLKSPQTQFDNVIFYRRLTTFLYCNGF